MQSYRPCIASLLFLSAFLIAGSAPGKAQPQKAQPQRADSLRGAIQPKKQVTRGEVTVDGRQIEYDATAGTIILRDRKRRPTASVFYVAYTKRGGEDPSERPVTFFYNGGPGSSTIWLHMGSFGPKRVKTFPPSNPGSHELGTHPVAAPYQLVENHHSLLDVTDLVFVDAVGTGYSRILSKDEGGAGKPEEFYGVDEDAKAFAHFITRYLTKYGRWNSPKLLFGESYGTMRSAALAYRLQTHAGVDLNGIVLLSSVLNLRTISFNAGNDLPYALFLPSYAAVAWYHHQLPNRPEELKPFLEKVEQFALTDYIGALAQGHQLDEAVRERIVDKLHAYTGLPKSYIREADLRVTPSQFEHKLLDEGNRTVGRLDARFVGPMMYPLSDVALYDPQSAALTSAYVSLFNQYVHSTLNFAPDLRYRPSNYEMDWDWQHESPSSGQAWPGLPNVAVDLARAMKRHPGLQVMVASGYFDLATPYFAADYTTSHLPIPEELQKNITTRYYRSGHMIYVRPESLEKLHDDVAQFIEASYRIRQGAPAE